MADSNVIPMPGQYGQEFTYKHHHVVITYRPRTSDFVTTITRTYEHTHAQVSPSMDIARKKARKYIDRVTGAPKR